MRRGGTDLALDVNAQGVGELERVEEGVGDDGGPVVGAPGLEEPADHLGPEDAAELVAQLDGVAPAVGCDAGLDPHVELACGAKKKRVGVSKARVRSVQKSRGGSQIVPLYDSAFDGGAEVPCTLPWRSLPR